LSNSGKFRWANEKDSIKLVNANEGFDSAFVCLGVGNRTNESAFFGDSTVPMTFELYRITTTSNFVKDSTYRINQAPGNVIDDGVKIGSVTVKPEDLKKYHKLKFKQTYDSVNNMIRIPINEMVGKNWVKTNLLQADSQKLNDRTGFTSLCNGFVIKVTQGNTLIRTALNANQNSRMEIWYKHLKDGKEDTARQYFFFNASTLDPWICANANFINRSIAGSAMQAAATPGYDNLLYIESTPGSYARIKIPYIKTFPNKIIHRAELIVEEAANRNTTFYSPARLMLDCFDTLPSNPNIYRTVPFDYFLTNNGTIDFGYFGGDRRVRSNLVAGGLHSQYIFNITKYFQSLSTKNTGRYDFRLFAPFDTRYYAQEKGYYWNFNDNYVNLTWPTIVSPGFGRVVVGGGNNANYKMKLKVIYSNL
jgi:hypothetical protein